MQSVIRAILVIAVMLLLLPKPCISSIIFEPGKKAKYVPPGEEGMSGDAAELCQTGQEGEKDGHVKLAIRGYKTRVKRHPKDGLAPAALDRAAQLPQRNGRLT